MSVDERCRIFNKMVAFIRQIDIRDKYFYIEKKHISDVVEATGRLSKQISGVILRNYKDFYAFDDVKIYYDDGYLFLIFCLLLFQVSQVPSFHHL